MSVTEQKLKELGVTLPPPLKSMGSYVTIRQTGDLLYTSGGGPIQDGKPLYHGKVGAELTAGEGYEAAAYTALVLLSILKEHLGDLDRIVKVVKVLGFVASAPDFYDQPAVINGFSNMIVHILGEPGKHARSAVAVPQLPFDTPVEVEMIVEIRS